MIKRIYVFFYSNYCRAFTLCQNCWKWMKSHLHSWLCGISSRLRTPKQVGLRVVGQRVSARTRTPLMPTCWGSFAKIRGRHPGCVKYSHHASLHAWAAHAHSSSPHYLSPAISLSHAHTLSLFSSFSFCLCSSRSPSLWSLCLCLTFLPFCTG